MNVFIDTAIGQAARAGKTPYGSDCVRVSCNGINGSAFAAATEGHVAVVRRCKADADCLVPAKLATTERTTIRREGESWSNDRGQTAPVGSGGPAVFPRIGGVLPDSATVTTWIAFDADEMLKLAKAITTKTEKKRKVVLGIVSTHGPVLAIAEDGNGVGVIMPARSDIKNPAAAYNTIASEYRTTDVKR